MANIDFNSWESYMSDGGELTMKRSAFVYGGAEAGENFLGEVEFSIVAPVYEEGAELIIEAQYGAREVVKVENVAFALNMVERIKDDKDNELEELIKRIWGE